MLSPLETGTTSGATPRTWEEPGDRSLARVPDPGGRRAVPAKPGNRLAWRGEAGQGPSISYMEGPCLILPWQEGLLAGTGTPGARQDASRDDLGSRSRSTGGLASKRRPPTPGFLSDLILAQA